MKPPEFYGEALLCICGLIAVALVGLGLVVN
jgi:hypothetical protein